MSSLHTFHPCSPHFEASYNLDSYATSDNQLSPLPTTPSANDESDGPFLLQSSLLSRPESFLNAERPCPQDSNGSQNGYQKRPHQAPMAAGSAAYNDVHMQPSRVTKTGSSGPVRRRISRACDQCNQLSIAVFSINLSNNAEICRNKMRRKHSMRALCR